MPLFGKPPDIESLKRKKDVRKLVKALAHGDPSIRSAAVEALQELDSPEAVPALLTSLDDPDAAVVKVTAIALGKSGDPRALEPLLDRAGRSEALYRHAMVTGAYLHNLAKRGEGARVAVALQHPNVRLRQAAVSALAWQPQEEVVPALITALDDGDRLVRHPALKALAALGPDPRTVDALSRRVRDPAETPQIREQAIELLAAIEDPRVVDVLIEVLQGGTGGVVTEAALRVAAEGLGRASDPRAIPMLAKRTQHESETVASSAVQALGRTHVSEALPPLLEILDGGRPALRGGAIRALGELGDPRAVPPLRDRLKTAQWVDAVRALRKLEPDHRGFMALAALASHGTGACDDLIRDLRRDPDGTDPVPPLVELLEAYEFAAPPGPTLSGEIYSGKGDTRLGVILVLADVGDDRAIPALERCSSSDPWSQYPDWSESVYGPREWPRRDAATKAIEAIRARG